MSHPGMQNALRRATPRLVAEKRARAAVLAVLPHDSWCKAGGSDHADCCRDEITECGCIAAESLEALLAAGMIEVQP